MNRFLIPLLFVFIHSAHAQNTISVSGVLTITQTTSEGTYITTTAVELCDINDRPLSHYVEQDEGVLIYPAPGYRYNLFYWNARWWTEYEYLTLPQVQPLCILKYYAHEDTEVLWLENVRMSDRRFKAISELFKDENFYAQCCGESTDMRTGVTKLEDMRFVSPGLPGQTTMDLEALRGKILLAILQSRK